jgi:hypothetical protein
MSCLVRRVFLLVPCEYTQVMCKRETIWLDGRSTIRIHSSFLVSIASLVGFFVRVALYLFIETSDIMSESDVAALTRNQSSIIE